MRIALLSFFLLLAACADPRSRHLGSDAIPLGGNLFQTTGRNSELLVLDGRIDRTTFEVFTRLSTNETTEIRGLIIASSPGGVRPRAAQLAQRIKADGLNTAILGACFASCVDVFLAGSTRGMARDAVLGVPVVNGRFATYALNDASPIDVRGSTFEDDTGTFRLVGQEEAFRLGWATEIFE